MRIFQHSYSILRLLVSSQSIFFLWKTFENKKILPTFLWHKKSLRVGKQLSSLYFQIKPEKLTSRSEIMWETPQFFFKVQFYEFYDDNNPSRYQWNLLSHMSFYLHRKLEGAPEIIIPTNLSSHRHVEKLECSTERNN